MELILLKDSTWQIIFSKQIDTIVVMNLINQRGTWHRVWFKESEVMVVSGSLTDNKMLSTTFSVVNILNEHTSVKIDAHINISKSMHNP